MAFGPVLYGPNRYGLNDYSTNPVLLVASDSLSETDTTANALIAAVSGSMNAPTDSTVNAISTTLADMLPTSDAVAFGLSVTLTDFLLCKEFIASHVTRSQAWTIGGISRTVTPHKYGSVLYAKNMYSTNIALLWAATKKDVTPTFTNVNGHKYNS